MEFTKIDFAEAERRHAAAAGLRTEDIHRKTAAEALGKKLEDVTPEERRAAKAVNYGRVYGSTFDVNSLMKRQP